MLSEMSLSGCVLSLILYAYYIFSLPPIHVTFCCSLFNTAPFFTSQYAMCWKPPTTAITMLLCCGVNLVFPKTLGSVYTCLIPWKLRFRKLTANDHIAHR